MLTVSNGKMLTDRGARRGSRGRKGCDIGPWKRELRRRARRLDRLSARRVLASGDFDQPISVVRGLDGWTVW